AAAEARQRRHAASARALVIAARVGSDLGVGAPQQRIVDGGVDARQPDAGWWRHRLRGSVPAASAASPATAAWKPAEAAGEVQLLRLPGTEPFADLLGKHPGIAGREVGLPRQDRRRLVRAIAAPTP